jgi:serine/threonine-protein kinase
MHHVEANPFSLPLMSRRIDRHVLHERFAEGGMASVWLGSTRGDDGSVRVVAIKEMQRALAQKGTFRQMFLDEARTVSRVRHPCVVETYDVLTVDDELFLVMEYVHGPTLAEIVAAVAARGEHVPFDVGVRLLVDLLEGLEAAHVATSADGRPLGIVHRDVSPHNVLVGPDGRAKVADFGVAMAADRGHRTATGEVKGKAGYMAPEQARSERVDARADVYSAGIVAFELFALAPPFGAGAMAEVLARVLFEPVPPLSERRADAPVELEAVVAVALSKDPPARFPTARDFAEALVAAVTPASHERVAAWTKTQVAELYAVRDALVARAQAESAALSGERSSPITPLDRRKAQRVGLLVGIALLVSTIALVAGSKLTAHDVPPSEATSPSIASTSSASTRGASASTPSVPSAIESVASVESLPRVASASPQAPTPARVAAQKPSASPPPASAAPTPTRPCCLKIGSNYQRYAFGNCSDNCPPGTP